MAKISVALIIDIVGSRQLSDRPAAQRAIHDAFAVAAADAEVVEPLWATVGDEFQAVFPRVRDALRVTSLMRLVFPDAIDCRFGLGSGDVRRLDAGRGAPIYDGSAWYHARGALDEVDQRSRNAPGLRTWFHSDDATEVALVTSHLILRDHLIDGMSGRERRLAAGALRGEPQQRLAESEGITQPAVSQNLRRSGAAALIAAHRALEIGADA
ncbi:SatD family protein [Microcella putealis]|uniref:SatD family protein n=1 Tax=Microcella putealis TaxID=337005 RepID=A0A4Q7LJT7_9MICO|nr:SatD family protein [Microcella putealis]RZS54382.1 SatD family protein [Microcella putealis]TQM24864.1 SatD family protein [Microcella putealis]